MNNPKTVFIIGGGVAGISAAVSAIKNGWHPVILERTGHLGGRVRSLYAKDVGSNIDNGQHVLSASYQETRQLLFEIGSHDRVTFQEPLFINFRISNRHEFQFKPWRLPAPLHFVLPLFLKAPLARSDRQFMRRWGLAFWRADPEKLKRLTVREWLEAYGEAPLLERLFWEPITLATLNTSIDEASAFLLYQVLINAFVGSRENTGLGLPNGLLDTLFAEPAAKYISAAGGEIRTNCVIQRIIWSGNSVQAVETRDGKSIETPHLISAIPPNALMKLLSSSNGLDKTLSLNLSRFEFSPIITVNIWTKKPIPGPFPIAMVDSPIQWVFPMVDASQKTGLHGYTLVISAAFKETAMSNEEIIKIADREFQHYFSQSLQADLKLDDYKIIKEKTATFLQTPQSLKYRPAPATAFNNFFLSGDWIDTALPATIESAVLSGRMAVELLKTR